MTTTRENGPAMSEPQPYSEQEFEAFVRAYVEALIWTVPEPEDEAERENLETVKVTVMDQMDLIAPEALESMRADCKDFVDANIADLRAAEALGDYAARAEWDGPERAGHDFALTRNRHGAGFWDRGLGEVGERLTAMAHPHGESNLYLGDDDLFYVEG